MIENSFQTITYQTEGFYKEKGSRFIAHAIPVTSEEEIKSELEGLRKTYYDARHHCYAYIIGLKDQSYRANDDGEPNHSAGDPILGQIRSKILTNTLVVVIRYFGGTKLGVGGLIHAYKTAAEAALEKANVKIIYSKTKVHLSFGYENTSEVERALSEFDIEYLDKQYTDSCLFRMMLKDEDYPILKEELKLLSGVKFDVTDGPA